MHTFVSTKLQKNRIILLTFGIKALTSQRKNKPKGVIPFLTQSWSDARVAEEARLESVCTPKAYRGFESPSLR